MTTDDRISRLRALMKEAGIEAVIIPQSDPHMSEYIAERYQLRRFLSGFTGSAGSLVVTPAKAFLWADSRYWLQAENQLAGTCISVMKEGQPFTPTITGWLTDSLPAGSTVGIDGMLFSKTAADTFRADLTAAGLKLDAGFDVAPSIWPDRPSLPDAPVFLHDEKFSGESAASKLHRIFEDAASHGADAVFISDLAEIAWALNIRSRDVECNPVAISYLYIGGKGSTLFITPGKTTPEVDACLANAGVSVEPYSTVADFLSSLPATEKVLVSPGQTPASLAALLGDRMVEGECAAAMMKGCKNDIQIAGLRRAMVRDGVALVKAFMEIERRVGSGEKVTEMDVADILTCYRSRQDLYFDRSFATIAGSGPHGAIVHYSANPSTNVEIPAESLLLVDSGASYLDGTTDITRTVYLGHRPPLEMVRDFTLVLKGHIDLATAVFPEGTCGMQLDILARLPLWKEGKTYLHGTGHGVGHFLNVHEGPQRITFNANTVALRPGMVTSDEPGLYLSGRYGIRCENLVLTTEAFTTEFGRFLRFETLTLFPFDKALIDRSLLSVDELQWLDCYQRRVYEALAPHLDEAERQWLRSKTE